jgi:predicted transcriptional regulator of viral defense system
MTERADTIRLSHLEQTIYFAGQRQGVNLLDADLIVRLVDVSRPHAANLLASMARKSVLYHVGRGRYTVIPPSVLHERKSYVIDPHLVLDELMRADGGGDRFGYVDRMGNQALTQRLSLMLERLSAVQTVDQDLIAGIARRVGPHTWSSVAQAGGPFPPGR